MTLFDQKERTLLGPAGYNSDQYIYFNDSARSDIGCARNLMESWFTIYPEDEKLELKSRFVVDFYPTFFELYIFKLFTELGFTLIPHPEVIGTNKRPDYLASKGDHIFYIEVKYIFMLSATEQGLEKKKNAILDAINNVDAHNFLIVLDEITFKDHSQPRGKNIIRFFNEQVRLNDPEIYTKHLTELGFEGMPSIIYEDEKITINAKLWPKSPLFRGTDSRAIGSLPTVKQIGNDSDEIRTTLKSKATRYDHLNAPYIICLNKQNVGLDLIELNESLYGSLTATWYDSPEGRKENLKFGGNGFWGSKSHAKNTRVSAVYLTNANPGNLGSTVEHALRHNPFAKYPLDLSFIQSIQELFNIPDNYPNCQD